MRLAQGVMIMNGITKTVLIFASAFLVVLLSLFVGEAMTGDALSNGVVWHGNLGGVGWM